MDLREPRRRPYGVTALGCFFTFGALVSGLSVITFLLPGTPLDAMWKVNPRGWTNTCPGTKASR